MVFTGVRGLYRLSSTQPGALPRYSAGHPGIHHVPSSPLLQASGTDVLPSGHIVKRYRCGNSIGGPSTSFSAVNPVERVSLPFSLALSGRMVLKSRQVLPDQVRRAERLATLDRREPLADISAELNM